MPFIVHGATGAQGAPVLAALRLAGLPAVAAARRSADLPDGTDAVTVDLADAGSLADAYRGADGVFVHLPIAAPDQTAAYAAAVAEAIESARPARVVISTSGQIVDAPDSALQAPPDSPIATLIRRSEASGVSTAVVAPRLYLENLLLPVVVGAAREEGVLRYPLPASFPVSWSSHLDVAEAVARLLADSRVDGVVAVGHRPGLTGPDLAEGFAAHWGVPVRYEGIDPDAFGELIRPLFGPEASAPVVGLYRALNGQQANVIAAENSAQSRLGLAPRTVAAWLAEIAAPVGTR